MQTRPGTRENEARRGGEQDSRRQIQISISHKYRAGSDKMQIQENKLALIREAS